MGGRLRRAFSSVGGAVKRAGDARAGDELAALFALDRSLDRQLTHGFHSYAGRMHPSVARGALERWSQPGDLVLDPFCGSGTVLVESLGLGRRACGVDASPLAVMVAAVSTTPLGPAGRRALLREANRIACEARGERGRAPASTPGSWLAWLARERARFAPHVLRELLALRVRVVLDGAQGAVGRALLACFSSLLVKLGERASGSERAFPGKRLAPGFASRMFAARAAELARGLEAFERRIPRGTAPAVCELGDARALAGLASESVDLVLTSPPYAGTYDYVRHHGVRFVWLGLQSQAVAAQQLGARRGGLRGAAGEAWREGRRRALGEMGRVLRPGRCAILLVGDGVVDGEVEDAARAVAEAAGPAGLTVVARASQARPLYDRRLAALFGAHPRREHILLLRRG